MIHPDNPDTTIITFSLSSLL